MWVVYNTLTTSKKPARIKASAKTHRFSVVNSVNINV